MDIRLIVLSKHDSAPHSRIEGRLLVWYAVSNDCGEASDQPIEERGDVVNGDHGKSLDALERRDEALETN